MATADHATKPIRGDNYLMNPNLPCRMVGRIKNRSTVSDHIEFIGAIQINLSIYLYWLSFSHPSGRAGFRTDRQVHNSLPPFA